MCEARFENTAAMLAFFAGVVFQMGIFLSGCSAGPKGPRTSLLGARQSHAWQSHPFHSHYASGRVWMNRNVDNQTLHISEAISYRGQQSYDKIFGLELLDRRGLDLIPLNCSHWGSATSSCREFKDEGVTWCNALMYPASQMTPFETRIGWRDRLALDFTVTVARSNRRDG